MKADKGRIIYDIIGKDKVQYSIPVYQRNYDWPITQCEKLYKDIINSVDTHDTHFIGTLVLAQIYSPNKLNRHIIVDGQQRITTIILLLKALLDNASEILDKDKITNWIFNEDRYKELDETEESKLKLKPIKADNIQLRALLSNDIAKMDKSSNIYRNYEYFKKRIAESLKEGYTIKEICNAIEDLTCVIIVLDATDKPQEVFESINSKGQPLTLSDLLRNFILMTDKDQDKLYNDYWLKIEEQISKELMPNFLIDYLNFKIDRFVKEADSYEEFKKLFKDNNYSNESMLKELLHYATFYNYFLNGSNTLSFEINESLSGLRQLKQTTIYIFLFKVFDDYENKVIDTEILENILRFFLNYSVRRSLCSVGSNSLRSLYKYLYARLFSNEENKKYYLDTILSYFKQLTTKDALIGDEELKEILIKADLYHKNVVCKYILNKIENSNSKEIIEVKNLTIEHIMPQNPYLNKGWRDMLGNDWERIQSTYLHTLGNLTLTGYNKEMSDKSFLDKKELLSSMNSKITVLNKEIAQKQTWNESVIIERAERLSDLLAKIFNIEEPKSIITFNDKSLETHSIFDVDEATGLKPFYYTLENKIVYVNDFKDMLDSVILNLYDRDSSIIERIAKNEKQIVDNSQRIFISYDSSKFNSSEQIGDTGIYYNVQLSAKNKLLVIKSLLNEYDIDLDDFTYTTKASNA